MGTLRGEGRQGGSRRLRALRLLAVAGAAGIVSAPLGWMVSDALESDNDFCNACHLEPGLPLHIEIRRDFDAEPPSSLAGLHGSAPAEHRPDEAFRCIDCHGGVSFAGRLRVKALAARDALVYLSGRFEEPDGMRHPLWDEDCRQCHGSFPGPPSEAWEDPRFHELDVHNVELGVDCVECHLAHDDAGDPDAYFLSARQVRGQCARCHAEFEEGQG